MSRIAALISLQALLLAPSVADATLGLTLVSSPQFGLFYSGGSGRQFVLNTNGTITGTDADDYISGAMAGQFTVTDDSAPAAIVILVDNIVPSGGLSVADATCSYDGGPQESCDAPGMTDTSVSSATLKVGLDISTTQAHSGGDAASVSMDVSVTYL